MKLWTFLFASPEAAYAHARVAAPDRAAATALLAGEIGGALGADVLCHYAGEVAERAPAVLRLAPREAAP